MKTLIALIMVLLVPLMLLAQTNGKISGVVTDQNGDPLVGANVVVVGTTLGDAADPDGRYTITVPVGTYSVRADFIGYEEKIVASVTVSADQTSELNFQLELSAIEFEEMVVIGYTSQRKADVSSAVSSVNVENLQKLPGTNVAELMQGQVAGVLVTQASGTPGLNPVIRIRGIGTIGNNQPLFVIDGIPGEFSTLDPDDVESIDVLKDAAAATIYGSRAANGVVMITTKRGQAGPPRVQVNSYIGSQSVTNTLSVANREQYNQISRQSFQAAGQTPLPFTVGDQSAFADTDWQDAIFRNGLEQKYDLSISGGTDNYNYHISGSYFNQEGIVIETGHEKFNFRVNSDYKINKFKFGESLSIVRNERDRFPREAESERQRSRESFTVILGIRQT